jgi:PAS domain S-box-containing protein
VASEAEERFHHMADSMPQLVWTAHADGVVDYYNQRYREFFGIRPDTLQEDVWQWAPSLPPDDVDVTVAAWNTAVQNGTVYEIEHRVTMADGSYRWYLSRGLPYRNERGEIVKWFGTATDIHDQKMAEQALRESETRFRRLMDSNIVGVFFARGDGLIDEANQAFLDMIGCSREDMRAGKLRWSEIIAPQALNQERAYLQQALRDGASGLHELNYIYNEGNPVPVLVGYAALANQGTDFVCFTLELSQQKEAERALEQYAARLEESNRNLEQFAYAASHDLQEPLRKIQSFGEILNQRVAHKLDADEADILARVRTSAKRLQVMIDSLLSLSRISSRTRTFSRIDTNALVQEVLADLEISIHTHHARVRVDSIPDLYGDPSQIHQLLQNLIGNAIKFHLPSKPPQVTVSGSSVSDTQVEIRVQDDGIGFSTAHLERMFRPFERLQPRSEFEGVGMGLAICSRIVERHAGTITAQSEPGKGSTFIVTLPKADNLDPGE